MLDPLNALVTQYDMLPRGCLVLCAVSGGADSVYLLHRLWLLRSIRGFDLTAAHYNHCLRGEESDRDEAFVRDFTARYCPAQRVTGPDGERTLPAVELLVGRGDVAAEAARTGRGIEETARAMRYAFLEEAAERAGADVIATAHTADDNAETILLHLLRGTALQGLGGIPPRRGRLIRPLLTTPRREIEDYLRLYGLPHVEDSSNSDDSYTSNRLRHQVMPVLEDISPGLARRMADTARYLRTDNDYLSGLARQRCAGVRWEREELVMDAGTVAAAPAALAPRMVRYLLSLATGGDTDWAAAHLEAVAALCRGSDPSAQVSLPGGWVARRVYGELRLTPHSAPSPPLEETPLVRGVQAVPGTAWLVSLDCDPWPGLVVRARRQGDELRLPGKRPRSVKKLLIDHKIPRWERERLPVAADGDGVLALAGFGPNIDHPRYDRAPQFFTQPSEHQEGMNGTC